MPISAATGQGIPELLFKVDELLKISEKEQPVHVVTPVFRRQTDPNWEVNRIDDETFQVTGERIERLVQMTKLKESESLSYLHRRLERIGVIEKLRELGVQEGDTVEIAGWRFDYRDW